MQFFLLFFTIPHLNSLSIVVMKYCNINLYLYNNARALIPKDWFRLHEPIYQFQ